ncbi:MAG: metal-dependent hydrolase [Lentisphaerae bacterium]|nr:metal-dependent hydrolase [Lentisphaerota bacterium]
MKGISHFITGVAAASCFPWTVAAAQAGSPLYFVLGAVFGLLPDTLDFKFYRFFYKHDLYVQPDPANPDPQPIADAMARGIEMARTEARDVRIKLSTIRLGADYWQQYVIKFDPVAGEVRVKFGPCVNTGQVPVPGTIPKHPRIGVARLAGPIDQTYDAVTSVDIFDGPSFSFEPDAQGRVAVHFLPWHRTWSHSLITGAALGLLGAAIWGWRAGLIIPVAFSAHVMEDQLGHMGSNLFWPITRRRFSGLKRMHATDARPNFLTVWTCLLLIFWNLYRFAPNPLYHLSLWDVVFYGGVLPLGLFGLASHLLTRGKAAETVVIDVSKEESDAMMA